MKTNAKSGMWVNGKVVFTLPAVLILVFMLSATTSKLYSQETKKETAKMVEKMPAYPGGNDALMKFMIENVKYPADAIKKNIQGKVFIDFIVKADGSISNVKVKKGIGGGCDEEAVRVVKLMPKWVPGEDKGKPVDVQYVFPVNFKLDAEKDKGGNSPVK